MSIRRALRCPRAARGALLTLALCSVAPFAHAEGSAQLGLNQKLLDAEGALADGYATDTASASLYVDIVTIGEVINVSLCGTTESDALSVALYAPSDDATPAVTLTLAEANVACADPMDAPLDDPLRHVATETGAWRLELGNETRSGSAGIFERHDVSVTPDAATLPDPRLAAGRLWAYTYSFLNGTFAESGATDADLYALIPGGRPGTNYIWQLDLNRFSGNGYNLLANSVGVDAPNSGYSVDLRDENGMPIGTVRYEHPLYLGIPEIADPRPIEPPVVENIRFRDSAGIDYTISPDGTTAVEDTGEFFFESDVPGTYSILIDLNADGVYGNAGDRQLLGDAVAGSNAVEWDGRDANGAIVAEGTYFAQVKVNMGEYHFVSQDAETSGGPDARGLTIWAMDKSGTRTATNVYWDDVTRLPGVGGTSNTPEGALSGTVEGSHTWGTFTETPDADTLGNDRLIDTYVYGLTTTTYAPVAVVADEENPPVNFDGRLTAPLDSLPGDTLEFAVDDVDLNLDAAAIDTAEVVVVLARTAESERVVLTETGVDTGRFTGNLATTAGTAIGTDDDGTIATAADDALEVTYIDLIDANGESRVLTVDHRVARDTDGDGTPNALDDDDDGDGVPDAFESNEDDGDGDGAPDSIDADSDDDGLPDDVETGTDPGNPRDTDGDGVPDAQDTDADGDGIGDAVEAGGGDADGDGRLDGADDPAGDANGDGADDATAANPLDTPDSDGDGTPDHLDVDADGDGVPDAVEGTGDADGDGVPDRLDLDSDDDGLPDALEGEASGADADGDGIDDAYDADATNGPDENGDGIDDAVAGGGGTDSDDDGTPDRLDTDSDGDGIADLVEAGGEDADNDGRVDAAGSPGSDANGDGLDDATAANPLAVPDTDEDGVADHLDLDADGDGLGDAAEAGTPAGPGALVVPRDTDGDGDADAIDTDSDGDGLDDAFEAALGGDPAATPADTDGNGTPDHLDRDSDADGIDDALEGVADTDRDGTPDRLDADSDGDGLPDAIERGEAGAVGESLPDADGDGTPDHLESDSDADGIPDRVEAPLPDDDADGDGIVDVLDVDATGGADLNGDGVDDAAAASASPDRDGDGLSNARDPDSDGDGIPDAIEAVGLGPDGLPTDPAVPVDSDGDGIADVIDTDSDDDGIPDRVEADGDADPGAPLPDSDGDGVPDYRETDSDGDGVVDAFEAGDDPSDPIDSDGDGTPDYREDYRDDDADGDGVPDFFEGTVDSDGDGVIDARDLDSDNDGIPDSEESGADGAPLDTDRDGVPDRLDLDSDGDGILDTIEGGAPGGLDTDRDGRLDGAVGDNGLLDALESATDSGAIDRDGDGLPDGAPDSDGDGAIDAIDLDADDDGIADLVEAGGSDANGDGRLDGAIDRDRDGRADSGGVLVDPDTDADGTPDRLDTDSDGDGVADIVEASGGAASGGGTGGLVAPVDTDGNGVADYLDLDSDGDGISDTDEANNADADGDGLPDALDSDGDGIPNGLEGTADSDGDGLVDALDADSDNDGIDDALEGFGLAGNDLSDSASAVAGGFVADTDGDGLADRLADTDGDGVPDVRDLDSDNDGLSDAAESRGAAVDRDNDGRIDGFSDTTDRDGRADSLAGVPLDAAALAAVVERASGGAGDLDGDGTLDALSDVDRDGIPDSVDADVTGGPDADGDGIDDNADASITGDPDADGDGISDARDPDADGDGLIDDQGGDGGQAGSGQGGGANGGGDVNGAGDGAGADPTLAAPAAATPGGVVRGGVQGGGCSIASDGSRSDPLLPLLLVLSLAGFAAGHRRRPSSGSAGGASVPITAGAANGTSSVAFSLTVVTLIAIGGALPTPARAQGLIASDDDFERELSASGYPRRWYGAVGLGASTVAPDTSDVPGVDVDSSGQGGAQFSLGADVKPWLALELHAAELGEAELSSGETLGYRQFGGSVVFYAGAERHRESRTGLAAFGRVGLGYLSLTGSEGLAYEKENPVHLLTGIGVEYATRRGLAVRAEGIAFDADAQLLQLGLVYRFGRRAHERPIAVVAAEPAPRVAATVVPRGTPEPEPLVEPVAVAPVVEPAPVVVPAPVVEPEPPVAAAMVAPDADGDGVLVAVDACPDTAAGVAVDARGCALFSGTLDGVTFESASATLTPDSSAALDRAAVTLARYPALAFRLAAHTDDQGEADANLELSKQRALAVARYLVAAGVDKGRFRIRAFGERQPVASNETAAGRRANRRVELVVLRD